MILFIHSIPSIKPWNRIKANQLTDLKDMKRFIKEQSPTNAGLSQETPRTMNSATLKLLTLFIGAVEDIHDNKGNEDLQQKTAVLTAVRQSHGFR